MGRVKTRLAREIGTVPACRIYRIVTENLIRRLSADPRWRMVLAVAPDSAAEAPFWPRTSAARSARAAAISVREWNGCCSRKRRRQ